VPPMAARVAGKTRSPARGAATSTLSPLTWPPAEISRCCRRPRVSSVSRAKFCPAHARCSAARRAEQDGRAVRVASLACPAREARSVWMARAARMARAVQRVRLGRPVLAGLEERVAPAPRAANRGRRVSGHHRCASGLPGRCRRPAKQPAPVQLPSSSVHPDPHSFRSASTLQGLGRRCPGVILQSITLPGDAQGCVRLGTGGQTVTTTLPTCWFDSR